MFERLSHGSLYFLKTLLQWSHPDAKNMSILGIPWDRSMDLAKQTRTIETQLADFLIGVAQIIVAGLILGGLQRLARYLAVQLSYPRELLQVRLLLRANREILLLSMVYPSLKDSRRLSILFPVASFYLRGIQRIVWTIASQPFVRKSLAHVSDHNLGNKGEAYLIATRSAEVLAKESLTRETGTSWLTTFLFSSMFQLASMSIVDPDRHSEQTLLNIKNTLLQ